MSTANHLSLTVTPRTILGNSGKKFRKNGLIPAVIYGHGLDNSITISLKYNEFVKVYRNSGNTSVVDLDIEGKKVHTLVHDVQYHPVKDTFVHIDFLSVNMKKAVEAEVPLTFVGIPAPVKQDGAILQKIIEFVTVLALPDSIPHEIEVDLSKIETISSVFQVKDLIVPKGVSVVNEADEVIASVNYAQEEQESITPETVIGTPAVESTDK
jgi:large subunit ribosomal protein L25